MKRPSQIMQKIFYMVVTSSLTSQGDLKGALSIHAKESLALRASCKGNIFSITAYIIIVFLGFTCL